MCPSRSRSTARRAGAEPEALLAFLRLMEFNTLTKRIAETLGVEAPQPLAQSVGSSVKHRPAFQAPDTAGAKSDAAAGDRHARCRRCLRRRLRQIAAVRSHQVPDRQDARRTAKPGSRARATPAASRSTPRRPASTPCAPISSASRWRSHRARPATCRSATQPAATICSAAAGSCRPDPRARSAGAVEAAARRSRACSRSGRT